MKEGWDLHGFLEDCRSMRYYVNDVLSTLCMCASTMSTTDEDFERVVGKLVIGYINWKDVRKQ